MKTKLKSILSLLLGVGLLHGLSSCSDERGVNNLSSSDLIGDYPISINLRGVTTAEPQTYGSVSAESFESNLSTTHALIFSKEGKYLGIRPVTVTDVQAAGDATHDTKAKATFDLGTSLGSDGKTVQFVLVGNLNTTNFNTEIEALRVAKSKATINDLTLEDIKMLRITQAPDAKDHFVMLGQPQGGGVASVTVKRNIPQEYPGVIDMERLSARIDVKIGGGTNNAGLSVTGVKLMKKQGHSYLYEKGGNPSGESLTSGEDASAMYTEAPFEKKIYTYENSVAEATYVEVSLALNGVALKPITVPFTGKAIERNHIYTVSLDRDPNDNPNIDPNLNQPRITFKVDVNDWNVDYRYIEDYADESAPVIVKTTRYNDENFSTPDYVAPLHTYDQGDNIIHITSLDKYYMLIDVESKSTQSVGEVIEGRDWMTLSDATTYSGMRQQYRLSLTHFGHPTRVGKIEFRNKLNPERKLTVTVIQGRRPNFIVPDKPSGLKLPLEYVAEYNGAPGSFATSHSAGANLPTFTAEYKLNSDEYHVPSVFEWNSIFPKLMWMKKSEPEEVIERVKVGAEGLKTYTSTYKVGKIVREGRSTITHWKAYGLRYQGDGGRLLSAWRYTFEENPEKSTGVEGPDNYFTAKCIYLGPSFRGTLDDIANEEFWLAYGDKAVTRYFAAPGNTATSVVSVEEKGVCGVYLSSTSNQADGHVAFVLDRSGLFTADLPDGRLYMNEQIVVPLKYNLRLFHGPASSFPPLNLPEKPSGVKLPIEYVAEHNVNVDKTNFANSLQESGLFRFEEISAGFRAPAFVGYHVPTKDEWLSIIPENIPSSLSEPVSETVMLPGDGSKTYTSHYTKRTSFLIPELYAIRYQGHGNSLRSAWCYSLSSKYIGTSYTDEKEVGFLKVTCVYLGSNFEVTLQDLEDGFFERVPVSKKITRTFVGQKTKRKNPKTGAFEELSSGKIFYPSRTKSGNNSAFFVEIFGNFVLKESIVSEEYGEYDAPGAFHEYYYPVRLFKDQ